MNGKKIGINICSLFVSLGKGTMETFWLTGTIDNESVQGNLRNTRPKMVPQISFRGTKDDCYENDMDGIEQQQVKISVKIFFKQSVKAMIFSSYLFRLYVHVIIIELDISG